MGTKARVNNLSDPQMAAVASLYCSESIRCLETLAFTRILALVELYADSETFQAMGNENALLICNHRSDVDWLVGWVLAQRSGCLGSALAIMRKEMKFIPLIGWSMWFSDYIFLEKTRAKDKGILKSGLQQLEDFPTPFWLALFVEGTRFSQAKLLAAQEYAGSRGLPIPRNVLVPRNKGLIAAVNHLRSVVPAIYDCTLAVPISPRPLTMLRLLRGYSYVLKVEIKRHAMQELPETADGIADWCSDVFITKDALLERYYTKDTFSDQQPREIGPPKKSCFVIFVWFCLVIFGIVVVLRLSSLLSTWEGIVFSAVFLVLVTAITQIVLMFSELVHSKLMKMSKQDQVMEHLLHK